MIETQRYGTQLPQMQGTLRQQQPSKCDVPHSGTHMASETCLPVLSGAWFGSAWQMFNFESDAPLQRLLILGFSMTAKHAADITVSMTSMAMAQEPLRQEASEVSNCRQKIPPAISLQAGHSKSGQAALLCIESLQVPAEVLACSQI